MSMQTKHVYHGLRQSLVLLFVCALGTVLATAQNYTVTNLSLGGSYSAITVNPPFNALNQTAGYSYTAGDTAYHAFFYDGALLRDLGTLSGSYSYPIAVNASGQVVGFASTAGDSGDHAFSWTQAGGMVDLGTLGGSYSYATAVNASGQVVGYAYTVGDSGYHAFSWTQAGGRVDLNARIPTAPAGLVLYYASAVSGSGLIVADSSAGLVLLGGSSKAPVLGAISANDPVAVGSAVAVSAKFTDADTADTHTAIWTWGDGSPTQSGLVAETSSAGTATGSHAFAAAGVYTISLKITDQAGLTAQVSRDIVVYDPSAGFVTGGGWIFSPPGAYKANETLVGKATFGFVSKYLKGAKVPTGNTEFQFQTAKLNFHSETYDWLVVAGARAQYKGVGTVNGSGNYGFLLTAIDGQISGGGGVDKFRIKIWDKNNEDKIVYDNQVSGDTSDAGTPNTVLGGGSIVIHK